MQSQGRGLSRSVLLAFTRMATSRVRPEPWRQSGLVRGVGIPTPSGRHAVGCVDLMQRMEGDESGGLLVRVFYPTAPPSDAAGAREMQRRYPYAKWLPSKMYVKGYADYAASRPARGSRGSGIVTELVATLLNPKMPAYFGAPLYATPPPPPAPASNSKAVSEEMSDGKPKPTGDAAASSTDGADPEEVVKAKSSDEEAQPALNAESKPFPAIVFSHGLGGMRTTYSSVCCDLASHGYVVASVEHRDRSACVSLQRVAKEGGATGGRQVYADEWLPFYHLEENEKEFPVRLKQVRQRADDVKRSLDLLGLLNEGARVDNMMDVDFDFSQFKGRIDVGTAAVVGHSFGGTTSIQTLSEDPRFSCGIALDCWMVPIHRDLYEAGLQRPLLFINSFDFQWVENVQRMMKLSQPPDENGMSTCRVLTLRDTNHMSQSDVVFVVPNFLMRWGKYQPARDQKESLSLNMEVCHSFLRRHLLQDPDYLKPLPNLDGLEGHSEYLIFGTNLDLSKTEENEGVDEGGEAERRDNGSEELKTNDGGEEEEVKDEGHKEDGAVTLR